MENPPDGMARLFLMITNNLKNADCQRNLVLIMRKIVKRSSSVLELVITELMRFKSCEGIPSFLVQAYFKLSMGRLLLYLEAADRISLITRSQSNQLKGHSQHYCTCLQLVAELRTWEGVAGSYHPSRISDSVCGNLFNVIVAAYTDVNSTMIHDRESMVELGWERLPSDQPLPITALISRILINHSRSAFSYTFQFFMAFQ